MSAEAPRRVLVCDDEPALRHLMSEALAASGVACVSCPLPDRAWDLASVTDFSAYVVDLVYHDVPEGFELIRRLKADARTAGRPVVAVTGFGQGRAQEAREAGADLTLEKADFRRVGVPFLLKNSAPAAGPAPDSTEVLIVEDDEAILDLFRLGPREPGLSFRPAATVEEGWKLLVTRQPEALVLDRNLPDGDGLDLCRRVRRRAATSETVIVVMTADRTVADSQSWYAAGADTCLAKPDGLVRLGATIKALLRRRGPTSPANFRLGPHARLDRARRRLLVDGRAPVKLTPRQLGFFQLFEVTDFVSRRAAAAGAEIRCSDAGEELALNAFLFRLRKKVKETGVEFVTVRDEGIQIRLP